MWTLMFSGAEYSANAWIKKLDFKGYFHKCRPWQVLGRARWRTATKRRRRNTARQRWPTLTLLQKHPDRFRKRRWTWISLSLYLIVQWLKVSTFSFFRWRMAPLLPQDRPWNQSEGTNRQPFRQWTCTDPNGLRKIWVCSDFVLHYNTYWHLSDVCVHWESGSNW